MDARRQVVCLEHQFVLGDWLAQYVEANGGALPFTLGELRAWIERRVEEAMVEEEEDAAVQKRNLKALASIFHCSADPDGDRPASYLYRPEAGAPMLTCFWHRGSLLRLTGGPGKVEALAFRPERLDSMDAAAAGYLEAGVPDSAVALLEVVAHQRHKDPVAHNTYGYAALEAKDYDLAEEVFKQAASLSKGKVLSRAYYGLGLVYMERPMGRHAAIDYFRDALIRDRNFVDARYQMARTRVQLWEYDARSDIEKVLKIDPEYADAYMLMGDYYADLNKEYEQAIPWYTKYLALRPEDPVGRRRLSQIYLQVKDYDRVMETLLGFVQENPKAVDLLPIVAQACSKQDKQDMALSFFKAYVSKLTAEGRALYGDISRFASKEEVADYARTSGAEREAFLKRFWNGRDPDLSTRVNKRLLEHYRRVWYARENFAKVRYPWDMRGEVYVRFGEPDHRTSSQMMNAKQNLAVQRVKERMALDIYGNDGAGHTYVGPVYPVRTLAMRARWVDREALREEREVISEGLEDQQTDIVANSGGTRTGGETGLSTNTGGNQSQSSIGASFSTSGEDIDVIYEDGLEKRLGLGGEDVLKFGDYRPVLTTNPDMSTVSWESWVYTRVAGGGEITFTDESGKGNFDYAPVPMATELSPHQAAKFVRYAPENIVGRAVAAFPDFYTPEYDVVPFDFYFDVADFRGGNGHSVLEVYYGLPGTAARYVPEEDVTRLVAKRQAALVGAALDTVYRASGDLIYQASGRRGAGAFVPDVARLEVPPGPYRLEVRVRDRMTGRIGLYRKDVEVGDYTQEGLRLSSLALAWQIAENQPLDKFSKNGLHVIPIPTRTYPRGRSIFVYYEIYNLVRDEFGQTRYRVEYTIRPVGGNIISRLVRTFVGKKKEVAVGYEQIGYGEMETLYMELDLGETTPGRHYVKVSVTDLNSGEEPMVEREGPFTVAPQ